MPLPTQEDYERARQAVADEVQRIIRRAHEPPAPVRSYLLLQDVEYQRDYDEDKEGDFR
jgi:hypothetical protein